MVGPHMDLPRRLVSYLAEDDEDIRSVFEISIGNRYDVTRGEHGQAGTRARSIRKPDVVLLDWTLPEFRATSRMASPCDAADVPGCRSSRVRGRRVRALAARIGAVPCPKPCDVDQLTALSSAPSAPALACRQGAISTRYLGESAAMAEPRFAGVAPAAHRSESGDGVFDCLDRTSLDGLARRLGGERGRLLGEGVDALAGGASRALHYDELRKTGKHEQAVLLELAMADVRKRLQHRFDLLAGGAVTDRLGHRLQKGALAQTLFSAALGFAILDLLVVAGRLICDGPAFSGGTLHLALGQMVQQNPISTLKMSLFCLTLHPTSGTDHSRRTSDVGPKAGISSARCASIAPRFNCESAETKGF